MRVVVPSPPGGPPDLIIRMLTPEKDLASYRPHVVDALAVPYRGGRIFAAPGMTGGPTLARALRILSETPKPSYVAYARALGASGGRKILRTVLQLASFIMDHGLTLEEAFHQPRIDMSGDHQVLADRSLPADVIAALEAAYPTVSARRTVFPYAFACPAGVLREGDMNMGCTEIMSPWGDAVAQRVPS